MSVYPPGRNVERLVLQVVEYLERILHPLYIMAGLIFNVYCTMFYSLNVLKSGGNIVKVLITGATGLLGGHLIRELQDRGESIRALVLPVENADKLQAQGVEIVRGDITDASTLAPAVKDVDLIFHLAGMIGVWRPISD